MVNELGQTVGYIHEKGTSVTIVPVQSPVPVATQIPVFPAPVVVQRPAVAPAPVVPQVDTREKYLEDMRDLYYARGSQLKSRGNALLIGGAMGLAVGLATFIYAIEESYFISSNNHVLNNLITLISYLLECFHHLAKYFFHIISTFFLNNLLNKVYHF